MLFKNRTKFVGLTLLFIAAAAFWNFYDRQEVAPITIAEKLTKKQIPQAPVEPNHSNQAAEVSAKPKMPSKVPAEIQRMAGTPAEAAEVNDWFRAHGRYSTDDDYSGYNQSTLETLADGGDIQAMHALSRMYLDSEHIIDERYGFDGANKQLSNAAVHGSTQAFTELAIFKEAQFYSGEKDLAAKRAAGLEIMSLYRAQELRGDRWASLSQGFEFNKKLAPTAEESRAIDARAKEIIDDLQNRRQELGLGNFDNSIPDVVSRFFANVEKQPLK